MASPGVVEPFDEGEDATLGFGRRPRDILPDAFLFDRPKDALADSVVVEELEEDGDLIYEITVAEGDLGRVIGKGGRVANAIRTIAKAAAVRIDRRVVVDILD